jgi:hypothetical protein
MPKTPSASENIPSVNAYKNVFFVQRIYKSATSSHSKPGLFGTTTLKDLASATSSPPAEFTADSHLMRNCLEFPKPLYLGGETGLNFGGQGVVCSPIGSGDSESTKCETPFPAKKFSFGDSLAGPGF